MLSYFVTAFSAFVAGFVIAALLRAGRRQDEVRADAFLAAAVDRFTRAHADVRTTEAGDVLVPREQIVTLRRALMVRDEQHSA